jgi:hypothetical protein
MLASLSGEHLALADGKLRFVGGKSSLPWVLPCWAQCLQMVEELQWETRIVWWKIHCLAEQKNNTKQTNKKISQQVVLAHSVPGDSGGVKSNKKFSSEVQTWRFLLVP